jgi:hypothetical protein
MLVIIIDQQTIICAVQCETDRVHILRKPIAVLMFHDLENVENNCYTVFA